MANLEMVNVDKFFGDQRVVESVSLSAAEGEFVVFVGPSGCGKSTLLRLIAGLEDPTGGDIRIGGESVVRVPSAARGVAMVFQSYALYPHMSVRENLSFSMENFRIERGEAERRIRDAARMLQIDGLLGRKPGQLSGGWRLAARLCASRGCFCWTSRFPTWTPSCGCRCGWTSARCTAASGTRWFM